MTIDEFRDKILKFSPSGFMAMNGAESGILGTSNSVSAVQDLQRATIEFTHQFKTGDTDAISAARKELTAKIMVSQTLGVMSEKTADAFLDDIAELMKGRK